MSAGLKISRKGAALSQLLRGLLLLCGVPAFNGLAYAAFAQAPALPQPQPQPQPHLVLVLDAAHGGDETGAPLHNNQPEKAISLNLSVRLRSLLAARGFQVITTRDSDAAVDWNRRAEIANHASALACITLHATESGSGIHLFVSSLAPAAAVRFPAWKTAQAPFVTRSLALAGVLNSALLQAGMSVTLGRTALGPVESMTCPAVAVELAPELGPDKKITSDVDDPAYQARFVEALAAALLEWRTEARQP